MYCSNCKKEVENGNFCRYCGNNLTSKKSNGIKVTITILIIIYLLYLVLVLPFLWGASAPDAVGGFFLFFGPPYMFITCCIPMTMSIGVINSKKDKKRNSIISLILYIISFFLLIFFGSWFLVDEIVDQIVVPILLLITITILAIINIIKNK